MKLLVVGDFHGEFPQKISTIVRKEKIDVVVSNGDYFPFAFRKLWFKHCYGTEQELWEFIGKKKYRKLIEKEVRAGERVLKALNALPVPVVTVYGNVDRSGNEDTTDFPQAKGIKHWEFEEMDFFRPLVRRYSNVHHITYGLCKIGKYVFIGAYGSSFPGRVKSKAYRRSKKKLDALFESCKHENVIFVSHNVPYETRLDKIGNKAHPWAKGRHYGSKIVRRAVDRWQPLLHVGGHIHEGRGMQRLGKTLCVNPGSVHEGKYAIVEVSEKGNVKVKFVG